MAQQYVQRVASAFVLGVVISIFQFIVLILPSAISSFAGDSFTFGGALPLFSPPRPRPGRLPFSQLGGSCWLGISGIELEILNPELN